MAVELELAPKQKRPAGARCCEPVVYPDVERHNAERMATIAKALGDPVRVQLVDVLRKHAGKVCVCELVPLFDLSQPTVSHHLKVLRESVPEAAVNASLGCGVPTAVADLHEGETVLDLGSGAGADVLISARRVGPTGKAIGLDMTDEMLDLARSNAADAGVENVEFCKGYIEQMPLADERVDVVISNCVINLSGDKPAVVREAARLLRPGGRIAG